MKKLSVILLCGILMLLLTGCQNSNTNNPNLNPNTNDNLNDQTDTNSSATTKG